MHIFPKSHIVLFNSSAFNASYATTKHYHTGFLITSARAEVGAYSGLMGDLKQEWSEGGMQPLSSVKTGGRTDGEKSHGSQTHNRDARRQFHGNTSRFGMVKESIAARKRTTTAASATEGRTNRVPTHAETDLKAHDANTATADIASVVHHTQRNAGQCERDDSNEIPPRSKRRSSGYKEEHDDSSTLLGPMGSFNEVPKVSSAADLIRTASHDQSSHSISQARGLRQANLPALHAEVARTGYYKPSDRIARLYTSTAVSLTSASAQSVAKASAALAIANGAPAGCGSSGAIVGSSARSWVRSGFGTSKVVTAPFATDSHGILRTLALKPEAQRQVINGSRESSDRLAENARNLLLPSSKNQAMEYSSRHLDPQNLEGKESMDGEGESRSPGQCKSVLIPSSQEIRTHRRENRSPPPSKRIVEVSPSREKGPTKARYAVDNFLSWDPPGLYSDDGEGGTATSNCYGHNNGGRDGAIGGRARRVGESRAAGSRSTSSAEAARQKLSIKRYRAAVEDRRENGSRNALGAGARSPLVELPTVRVGGKTEVVRR